MVTNLLRATFIFLVFMLFSHVAEAMRADSVLVTATGKTAICQSSTLTIGPDAVANGVSYEWSRNGLVIPNANSSFYIADQPGVYTLITRKDRYVKFYNPITITVATDPVADFTYLPDSECASIPIGFSNASTGEGLTYLWNFDDVNSPENTSTLINPKHRFIGKYGNKTQEFKVSLTITNSGGCSNTIVKTVTIKQEPNAALGSPSGVVLYNGQKFFTRCNVPSADFIFQNESGTIATNRNYRIIWGDNTPDYTGDFDELLLHKYTAGQYEIQLIVEGENGCTSIGTYYVFVGNTPAIGLETVTSSNICTGSEVLFRLTNTENNTPQTIYTIDFGDGTPPETYSVNLNPEIRHIYNVTSCNGTAANFFTPVITASVPCGSQSIPGGPIRVSQKPVSSIALRPNASPCVNDVVTIRNNGRIGNIADEGGCTTAKSIWKISPATGWTIRPGSVLGDENESTDIANWKGGTPAIDIAFTVPGQYTIKLTQGTSSCGNDITEKTICVSPSPTASFTVDETAGCGPLVVQTTNTSNLPLCTANSYKWTVIYSNAGCDFSSAGYNYVNSTETSAEPTFQFNNPGQYDILLETTVQGSNCIATSAPRRITVQAKPMVTLALPKMICQNTGFKPVAVIPACYSSADATYLWTFTGATTTSSTVFDPGDISYATPGTYQISLTATNSCGSITVGESIVVNPVANIISNAESPNCAPFLLKVAAVPENATEISWSFGDPGSPDNSSTDAGASHLFTKAGVYEITLTARNASGCLEIATQMITISGAPTASFSLQDSTSCTGKLSVRPANQTTGALSYVWNFGDGSAEATSVAPTHTYNFPGVYILRLIALNGACSDTTSHTIEIESAPVPSFTAEVTEGCSELTVNFRNHSLNASIYRWDFGDGTFSSDKDPSHTFAYRGTPYTIKLSAFGKFGCEEFLVKTNYITVWPLPVIDFAAMPDSVISIPSMNFSFINKTDEATEYSWDFGDGGTATAKDPSYTYRDIGTYTVTLTAINKYGCATFRTRTVQIKAVAQYLYVPNAFEPASVKSELQTFNVRGVGMANYHLQIFNKWGQLIFQTTALDEKGVPTTGWNGDMKGVPAPQGTYTWIIKARFLDGTEWKGMRYGSKLPASSGIIHLIR